MIVFDEKFYRYWKLKNVVCFKRWRKSNTNKRSRTMCFYLFFQSIIQTWKRSISFKEYVSQYIFNRFKCLVVWEFYVTKLYLFWLEWKTSSFEKYFFNLSRTKINVLKINVWFIAHYSKFFNNVVYAIDSTISKSNAS